MSWRRLIAFCVQYIILYTCVDRSRLQYNILAGGSIAWGDGGRARGATEYTVYTLRRENGKLMIIALGD